jgi:methylenetetrahydrofolate--tRNA-(uracil-5-)-methyltransferase
VEGYVESAGSGYLAGINGVRLASGGAPLLPPENSALGALIRHITNAEVKHFQPMNVNYGLFPELPGRIKKKERRGLLAARALAEIDQWSDEVNSDRK